MYKSLLSSSSQLLTIVHWPLLCDRVRCRCALTVKLGTRHGPASRLAFTSVLTVRPCIGTWACISLSSGVFPLFVSSFCHLSCRGPSCLHLPCTSLSCGEDERGVRG